MIDLTTENPITLSKICELFDVSRSTVDGWFKRGLRNDRVGGRVISSYEALNEFKRGRQPQETSASASHREAERACKEFEAQYGV